MGKQTSEGLRRVHSLERQLLWAIALGLSMALLGVAIWFGALNQDEGWYLYAARQVAGGMQPYRDFLYTQGPLLPRLYAVFSSLWLPSGLLGGRILTAAFAVAALGLSALTAARLAPRPYRGTAALICVLLLGLNPYHAYYTTVVKSYAAASALLMGGLYLLTFLQRHGATAALGSGLLLAAAASVRLSLAVALVVVGVYWLGQRRQPGGWRAVLLYGLGTVGMLAACFLPALLWDAPATWFGLTLHLDREQGEGLAALVRKAGYLARLTRFYFVPVLLLLLVGGPLWARRPGPQGPPPHTLSLLRVISVLFLLLLLLHGLTPMPYDEYQVPVMPLLAVVAAGLAAWFLASVPARMARFAIRGLFAAALLAACSSSLLQEWMVLRQDRLWLIPKTQSDLGRLRETARWIRDRHPGATEILTQDPYLAIELDWDVPPGFELAPFNYFPGLDDETALRFRVLNRGLLQRAVQEARAPVAAFSGYGFAIEAPAMEPVPAAERERFLGMLRGAYRPVREIPDFGQQHTTLTLYERINGTNRPSGDGGDGDPSPAPPPDAGP